MGGLVGIPLGAAGYRFASRRALQSERLLIVRPTIEPELVNDLVDFVRKVQGRAALEARDTITVPLPGGADEDVAYGELRALLHRWESLHPGVRLEIVIPPVDGRGRPKTFSARRTRTRRKVVDRMTRA